MKELKKVVADKLVELRKASGMTQQELAEKLNYSDKAISKWETGESLPGLEVLAELTRLYGVTLDYLVSEEAELPKVPDENAAENADRRKLLTNRLVIALLAQMCILFFAISIYVYSHLWTGTNDWKVFLWAIPVCAIVGLIFNGIWGKRIFAFALVTLLLWSLITAIYFQYYRYDFWMLFLLGIPPQTAIVLWSNMTFSSRKDKKNKRLR